MSKPKSDTVPLYEGMFLMDLTAVGGDLAAGLDRVRQLLEKHQAEVLATSKWDERRLVYPIKGQRRGTYVYALFRMDGKRIAAMERECELSEDVLRVLITRADHFGELEIEQAVNAANTTRDEAKLRAAGEGQGQGATTGTAGDTQQTEPTEPASTEQA
jgi:small subunit ribosomal protein S6